MKEESLISLKHKALTCLYIICKSFISNVNLIDQTTPWSLPHPFSPLLLSHNITPTPSRSAGRSVHMRLIVRTHTHTCCKGTHTAEVRPVSSGVWRPYLCIVLICVASVDRQSGPGGGWARSKACWRVAWASIWGLAKKELQCDIYTCMHPRSQP